MTDVVEGEVSQRIWDVLFPGLNGVNKHMSLFLTGCFNVETAAISPFAAAFSENVESILHRFVAYMPRGNTNNNPPEDEELVANKDEKAKVLLTVQEDMMKEIIAAAEEGKADNNHEEKTDDTVSTDVERLTTFTQQIYGENEDTAEATMENFAKLITCTAENKSQWAVLLTTAFSNLVMEQRNKGSVTAAQKFKGLNLRWFGSAKMGLSKDQESTETIRRGTIITIDTYPTKEFMVLALFSKSYNKWFMSQETPVWSKDAKKPGPPFRLSIREVKHDVALRLYKFASVTPQNANTVVYQLVLFNQITNIVEVLY